MKICYWTSLCKKCEKSNCKYLYKLENNIYDYDLDINYYNLILKENYNEYLNVVKESECENLNE